MAPSPIKKFTHVDPKFSLRPYEWEANFGTFATRISHEVFKDYANRRRSPPRPLPTLLKGLFSNSLDELCHVHHTLGGTSEPVINVSHLKTIPTPCLTAAHDSSLTLTVEETNNTDVFHMLLDMVGLIKDKKQCTSREKSTQKPRNVLMNCCHIRNYCQKRCNLYFHRCTFCSLLGVAGIPNNVELSIASSASVDRPVLIVLHNAITSEIHRLHRRSRLNLNLNFQEPIQILPGVR